MAEVGIGALLPKLFLTSNQRRLLELKPNVYAVFTF